MILHYIDTCNHLNLLPNIVDCCHFACHDSIDGCCANIKNYFKIYLILSTCQQQRLSQITTDHSSQNEHNKLIQSSRSLPYTYILEFQYVCSFVINFRKRSIWKIKMGLDFWTNSMGVLSY